MSLSTLVAEYVRLSLAVQEAVCLRRLLKDIQDLQNKPLTIIEDNQGAIGNPVAHSKTKHIDIIYYYTRGCERWNCYFELLANKDDSRYSNKAIAKTTI